MLKIRLLHFLSAFKDKCAPEQRNENFMIIYLDHEQVGQKLKITDASVYIQTKLLRNRFIMILYIHVHVITLAILYKYLLTMKIQCPFSSIPQIINFYSLVVSRNPITLNSIISHQHAEKILRSIRLHILKLCQFKSYNSVNTRKAIFTHLNGIDVLYSGMKARTRFRIQRISRCRK